MEHKRSLSQRFQDYGKNMLSMFGFKENSREPTATAIYKAAKSGQREKLEKLLLNTFDRTDRRSLLNIEDSKGNTPLSIAVIHGHIHCVSLLLDYGADVQHMGWNPKGGTPLHEAIQSWTPNNVIRLLLRAGACPFVENIKKKTPWETAWRRKDASLFREFEKQGKFAQYVLMWVFNKFENASVWVRRWISIIPRFSMTPGLQEKRYLSSTFLVFEDVTSYEPLFQFKLDDVLSSLRPEQEIGTEVVLTLPSSEATHLFPHVTGNGGKLQLRLNASDNVLQLLLRSIRENNVETADASIDNAMAYEDDVILAARLQEELNREMERQAHFTQSAQTDGAGPSTSGSPTDDTGNNISLEKEPSAPPRPPREGYDGGQSSSQPHVDIMSETDNLCVVCMDAPKSAGFAHGNSCHWCVCKKCGTHLWESGDRWCPLCRKPVDNLITDFFAD